MVRVTSTQTFHNSKVMQCLRIMFVYIFRGEKLNSTCYNMNLNRNSLCRLRVGSQNQPLVCPTRCGQCKDVCIQISTAVCSVSGGSEESGDSALPPQDRSGRWSSIDGTLIGLTSSYILWDTKPAADHTLKGGSCCSEFNICRSCNQQITRQRCRRVLFCCETACHTTAHESSRISFAVRLSGV